MSIKTIKIKNFKCFNSFELEDLKMLNFIGGKNNMGKTAFMEVCHLGLSTEDKRDKFLVECIDEIKLQDKEDELNRLLKQLFNIEKIDVIKNRVMLKKNKKFILSLSKEKNVQVFATTHSKECIEAYYKVSKKLNKDNISFINLSKNKKDEIIGIVFDRDMFFSEIEQNHEVRVW